MQKRQGNVCAICKQQETSIHQSGNTRELAVDHCHKTGKIRALLCGKCNLGIGFFDDKPELVREVIKYLELHQKHEDFIQLEEKTDEQKK